MYSSTTSMYTLIDLHIYYIDAPLEHYSYDACIYYITSLNPSTYTHIDTYMGIYYISSDAVHA